MSGSPAPPGNAKASPYHPAPHIAGAPPGNGEASRYEPERRRTGELASVWLPVLVSGLLVHARRRSMRGTGFLPSARARRALVGLCSVSLAVMLTQLACGSSNSQSQTTSQPAVTLSPSVLTFGSQYVGTTSGAQTINVTNSGRAALAISSITAAGDFAQTNTCPASLAAGASCAVGLTFTPTAGGSRTGTLTIVDNAPGSPHTVTLSGTGQATNGTPSGSYQVGISGTAGTLQQSGSVTLVVR